MKLDEYKAKRDPARTNEPFGPKPPASSGPTLAGAFVMHLHDATRRHYDLRLEVGGVLASFAIPKGPSLDPAAKHLAIHTEDHPLDYLDFEAVIPEGQYGAGPMILWDRGRVRYLEGPAEEEIERGKIDLELTGMKLRGRWALVRIKGSKNEWLFFKKADAYSSTTRDLVAEAPRSILSGLTVEELASAPAIAADLVAEAARLGAPIGTVDRKTTPMLCASEGAPLCGEGWLYELKLDGVRALAHKRGREVVLENRKLRDESARYPEIVRAVAALAPERVVLDGEIIALDESGQPSFQRLARRIHLENARDVARAVTEVPVLFVAFDVLAIGDRMLVDLPLRARKSILQRLVPNGGIVRALDCFEGDGEPLLAFCRERRLEGVVAKRASSPYRPGPRRSGDWVKIKCERDDELVVIGYTRGEGGRERLGALDVASYRGDELVVRGKVGSGLDEATIDTLLARFAPLVLSKRPRLSGKLPPAPRGRTFVKPEVVVTVRFLGWTDDKNLRAPVFVGIRDDKSPSECTAAPPSEIEAEGEPPPHDDPASAAPRAERSAAPAVKNVALTNRTKVLWPDDGYTKQDLWSYYRDVAPMILPYLKERPIVLVRYPDGITGKSFYQWNVPSGMPEWIRTLTIRHEGDPNKEVNVFLVDDVESLLYVANLACIPIHILASRAGSIDDCDFFTIDFDVKSSSLPAAIELAHELRRLLEQVGFESHPKTSGQSGLHVLVPLGPGIGFPAARSLADVFGRLLVHLHPKTATMERVVAKRGTRVYVDTGQTGPSRTIVAPWSVRATPGARVSTPLSWDELTLDLDPGRFTIATVPARITRHGDPMAPLLRARPDVPAAVARLEALATKLHLR